MAALCFKYLNISIQINSDKMADFPIVPNVSIYLECPGIAVEQIVPLVLKKSTQETQYCPAKKHNAENTSKQEEPVFRLLWWLLSGWWRFVVNNDALVSLLDHLICCCGVADRAT